MFKRRFRGARCPAEAARGVANHSPKSCSCCLCSVRRHAMRKIFQVCLLSLFAHSPKETGDNNNNNNNHHHHNNNNNNTNNDINNIINDNNNNNNNINGLMPRGVSVVCESRRQADYIQQAGDQNWICTYVYIYIYTHIHLLLYIMYIYI